MASSLAEEQRQLLALVRGRSAETPLDEYMAAVADSRELRLVREISLWWRCLSVRRVCVFTSRLLRCRGAWESTVAEFVRDRRVPAQIDVLAHAFLEYAAQASDDSLVRSVARFEEACLLAERGRRTTLTVEWPQEPNAVLDALLRGQPPPETEDGDQRWVTIVGNGPGVLFTVVKR